MSISANTKTNDKRIAVKSIEVVRKNNDGTCERHSEVAKKTGGQSNLT